jgi:hypothetical protein
MTPAQIAALIALVQQIIPIVVELLKKKEGEKDLDLSKVREMLDKLLALLQSHQKDINREAGL